MIAVRQIRQVMAHQYVQEYLCVDVAAITDRLPLNPKPSGA